MNGSKRRARVAALDAVRGFAIVAMIIAHAIPFTRAVTPQSVLAGEALLNDVASPLFAFVIGATLALNIGGLPRTERTRFRIQTAIKAAALIVLGFSLDLVEAHVAVVLDYLGAAMLVAIPLLFCSTRTLLAITAALCVAGPLITDAARQAAFAVPGLVYPVTPITVVLDWLALGESYRVLASEFGCRDILLDRTEEYCRVGELVTALASVTGSGSSTVTPWRCPSHAGASRSWDDSTIR